MNDKINWMKRYRELLSRSGSGTTSPEESIELNDLQKRFDSTLKEPTFALPRTSGTLLPTPNQILLSNEPINRGIQNPTSDVGNRPPVSVSMPLPSISSRPDFNIPERSPPSQFRGSPFKSPVTGEQIQQSHGPLPMSHPPSPSKISRNIPSNTAVVGEGGMPELVQTTGDLTVTPLSRKQARSLLSKGIPGYARGTPGGKKDNVGAVAGRFMEKSSSLRVEDVVSGLGSSMSSVGKAMGPAGAPVMVVGQFVQILGDSVSALRKWNETLHKSNMQFAEFSGAMAGVQMRQLVREIQFSQARGNVRAQSAEYLAQGQMELAKAMAPLEDALAKMMNHLIGFIDRALVPQIAFMAGALDAISLGFLRGEDGAKPSTTFHENLIDIARNEVARRPPRLRP